MILNEDAAAKVAEFLLQIKAIKLQPKDPFTWASGWKSPIYCDNRKTLSYPEIRTYIRQQMAEITQEEFGNVEMIAGVATGGIAIGALVAQELGVPFCYVRSSTKSHGMQNRIEGVVEPGQSVVVIEDLVSTGGSSLEAVAALREAECNVKGMLSVFTYGFEKAKKNFEKANCRLIPLCDYDHLIEQALKTDYISAEDLKPLQAWRTAPDKWSPKATA